MCIFWQKANSVWDLDSYFFGVGFNWPQVKNVYILPIFPNSFSLSKKRSEIHKFKSEDLEETIIEKPTSHSGTNGPNEIQIGDWRGLSTSICMDETYRILPSISQAMFTKKQFQFLINSLTPKSVPAGTKLVLFGRFILNIYVGIVRYFLRTTKLSAPKSTYRHNAQIGEYRTILTSPKKIQFWPSTHVID